MVSLRGRTAIVTGASTGIGRAVAVRLAEEGMNLALMARTREALDETVALARDRGSRVLAMAGDVGDRTGVAAFVKSAVEEFGSLDALVNNAGINTLRRGLADMSGEDWDRVIETNLTGAYNFAREVLPHMRRAGGGLIVNVASLAGKRASTLAGAAYSASKFGMASLTESVNDEENEHGIRASSVFPGEVLTPILDHRPQPLSPERLERILRPEDIAEAVLFIVKLPSRATVTELVIAPADRRRG